MNTNNMRSDAMAGMHRKVIELDDEAWEEFQLMLAQPAEPSPKLAELLARKHPWDEHPAEVVEKCFRHPDVAATHVLHIGTPFGSEKRHFCSSEEAWDERQHVGLYCRVEAL